MWSPETQRRQDLEATERALRQKLSLVTQLLSSLCQNIERTSQKSILKTIEDGKLSRWWENHKKAEAERNAKEIERKERVIALEHKKREEKATRDKVLQKLTPEEKRILGVK